MSKRHNFSNNQFFDTARRNKMSFSNYYERLVNAALSIFKWENLPDTIDEVFLERTLFYNGCALFCYDDVLGYLALKTSAAGDFNVYSIPKKRVGYGANGYHIEKDNNNSIIIYNNMLRLPSEPTVFEFANRLEEIDRAIDVNINAQKTPIIISCKESDRLALKNVYMKYEGNAPVIFANDRYDPATIKVISTNAPFVAPSLYQLKTEIWKEALTYLGVTSGNNKKERVIVDEIANETGSVNAMINSKLISRKQACKMINEMFGLNIDVKVRDEDVKIHDTNTVDM